MVAVALRAAAEKLEVNAEGTKVKRIDPLPDYDETTTSRLVWDLIGLSLWDLIGLLSISPARFFSSTFVFFCLPASDPTVTYCQYYSLFR